MLIYGNTPSDIRKMLVRNKKKVSAFLIAFVCLFLLLNCTPKPKQDPGLGALDKFWRMLGGDAPPKPDEVAFRWDWHLELCEEQLRLDHVLNQRVMIELNGKNGSVRCPISQFWPAVQYQNSI